MKRSTCTPRPPRRARATPTASSAPTTADPAAPRSSRSPPPTTATTSPSCVTPRTHALSAPFPCRRPGPPPSATPPTTARSSPPPRAAEPTSTSTSMRCVQRLTKVEPPEAGGMALGRSLAGALPCRCGPRTAHRRRAVLARAGRAAVAARPSHCRAPSGARRHRPLPHHLQLRAHPGRTVTSRAPPWTRSD